MPRSLEGQPQRLRDGLQTSKIRVNLPTASFPTRCSGIGPLSVPRCRKRHVPTLSHLHDGPFRQHGTVALQTRLTSCEPGLGLTMARSMGNSNSHNRSFRLTAKTVSLNPVLCVVCFVVCCVLCVALCVALCVVLCCVVLCCVVLCCVVLCCVVLCCVVLCCVVLVCWSVGRSVGWLPVPVSVSVPLLKVFLACLGSFKESYASATS